MNKKELETKLNELFVGKEIAYNYSFAKVIETHLKDLEIDNAQGEYGVRCDNYTFTIMWRQSCLVSFDVKRKQDTLKGWLIKQIIVEDEFVDYETSKQRIIEDYEKRAKRFDDCRWFCNDLETLKGAMKVVNEFAEKVGKNRDDTCDLIRDLHSHYWLIVTALELDHK